MWFRSFDIRIGQSLNHKFGSCVFLEQSGQRITFSLHTVLCCVSSEEWRMARIGDWPLKTSLCRRPTRPIWIHSRLLTLSPANSLFFFPISSTFSIILFIFCSLSSSHSPWMNHWRKNLTANHFRLDGYRINRTCHADIKHFQMVILHRSECRHWFLHFWRMKQEPKSPKTTTNLKMGNSNHLKMLPTYQNHNSFGNVIAKMRPTRNEMCLLPLIEEKAKPESILVTHSSRHLMVIRKSIWSSM